MTKLGKTSLFKPKEEQNLVQHINLQAHLGKGFTTDRRIQNEMSKQRITREVPQANVVITNPTHYAVALRYDPETSGAPIVVAKGTDHLAKQIIKIAKESGVAVVERKPVARFLYANVKIGHEIPFELYHAVAEILNYISRFKRAA